MSTIVSKPLDVRYIEALNVPTPAKQLIDEIAAVSRASVYTVRAWMYGKQKPSKAAMALLSDHFNLKEDELFSSGLFDCNQQS